VKALGHCALPALPAFTVFYALSGDLLRRRGQVPHPRLLNPLPPYPDLLSEVLTDNRSVRKCGRSRTWHSGYANLNETARSCVPDGWASESRA